MDYASLLGFPIEIVALVVICYTLVELTKLIINRKKEVTSIEKPAAKKSDTTIG